MRIFCKAYLYFYSAKLLFIAVLLLLVTISCSNINTPNSTDSNQSANANAENLVIDKDDVAELSTLVKLPQLPEETVWREEETPSPKGKKLTAVLKYNSENAARITAQSEKNKPPAQTEIEAESWFPEELTAQSQLSGNESLKGTAYGANDFFNAPYLNGRLVRVAETDYFILELTTY